MSIWASFFGIEDERLWIAGLESQGVKAGVIRDGAPSPEDLDAPLIYQGSHVLPEPDHPRGGWLDLAYIPPHVRYDREHPDGEDEPDGPPTDPYLRLCLGDREGNATVILTLPQAQRLRDALVDFCGWFELNEKGPGEHPHPDHSGRASPPGCLEHSGSERTRDGDQ